MPDVRAVLSRLKVRGGRPLLRALHRSDALRKLVLRRRQDDVELGLDPDIAWMLALADLTGDGKLEAASPDAARRHLLDSVALVEDEPDGDLDISERSVPGATGPIRARVYEPPGLAPPSAGLVYVHGGGWVTGDLDTHDTLCQRIALVAGMRVVSIAPRLAPEHPFPAGLEDTLAAFRFVARKASSFGIDAKRLAIGGDSAGGNLSAVVSLEMRGDDVPPALTLLLYPALDATRSMPSHREIADRYLLTSDSISWYLGHYLGRDAERARDPRVSPMLRSDLAGAPPALIAVAGFDPLRDESVRYAELLREAGTKVDLLEYSSLPHGFALMTALAPAARSATEEIAKQAAELLSR